MPKKTGITITSEFNGDDIKKHMEGAIKQALWVQGQALIAEAQRRKLVPLDTGTLRRSAVVTLNELPLMSQVHGMAEASDGNNPVVVDDPKKHSGPVNDVYVSYNTPYAATLHENLNVVHKPEWEPRDWRRTASGKIVPKPAEGEPKWIEKANASILSKLAAIAASAIRKYLP